MVVKDTVRATALMLNRLGHFSTTRGPGLLKELQVFNRKSAPAAITQARVQEPSAFRSVIRRLRGEAKKPRKRAKKEPQKGLDAFLLVRT